MSNTAKINDVVALLQCQAESKLTRGLVGTVVEELDAENILVEFSDENGRTYAITPVPVSNTLVLHYQHEAA
jgi:Domain of unknown function (DUF4926)